MRTSVKTSIKIAAIAFGLSATLFFGLGVGHTISPMTLIVNSTGDGADVLTGDGICQTLTLGECTLRAAIAEANAHANVGGPDSIHFDIPGPGPHTIVPTSPLPTITDPVNIDGYTQPGASVNNLAIGTNANLVIELRGSLLPNQPCGLVAGVKINGGSSTVRGLIINGFSQAAIVIGNVGGNTIEGNYIGTDVTGNVGLANCHGILINNAANNKIGGSTPATRNIISGNKFIAIDIFGASSTGTFVRGNYIGTNAAGNASVGNANGIRIASSSNSTIGGTLPEDRNVISGNVYGFYILDGNAKIQGNFIGTDVNGTADLGNHIGVFVSPASNNTIGGTVAGSQNLISGNNYGVFISDSTSRNNLVQGNLIGTDISGTLDLGNSKFGVYIVDSPSNTIGGTVPSARNVISGNEEAGLVIENASNNVVRGNFIGTNAVGDAAVPNGAGVAMSGSNNIIGGMTAGAGNVISGNSGYGISLSGVGHQIQGNLIGTQADGVSPLRNHGPGVLIQSAGANGNAIGGTANGAGNVIAYNGGDGVTLISGTNNLVLSNSIYANSGLGIDLGTAGVTPNDPRDDDGGANDLQNFPELTFVNSDGSTTRVRGRLMSTPDTTFTIDFFSNPTCDPSGYGEGKSLIGSAEVTTNPGGIAIFDVTFPAPVAPGQSITATATDSSGNTSEFSQCEEVR